MIYRKSVIRSFGRHLLKMCLAMCRVIYRWLMQQHAHKFNKKHVLILILCCTLFLCGVLYLFSSPKVYLHQNIHSRCIVPDLDPFDKDMMKYSWNGGPIVCEKSPSLVYLDKDGLLVFNTTAQFVTGNQDISCTYSLIERKDGDHSLQYQPEVEMNLPFFVPGDFFFVKCRSKKTLKVVYENLHHHVDYKKIVESRKIAQESDERLSVLIFGIDSTSRLSAIRKLPKTFKYLEKELGAFIFKGHNKVSERTFGNIVTILTGKKAYSSELPNIDVAKEYINVYPFIWKKFSEAGYTTMYSEDLPKIQTFYYGCKGFDRQPTDHYSRTLYMAMEKGVPFHFFLSQAALFLEDKKINLKKSSSLCYGNKPKHLFLIDYYRQFVEAYKGKLKFGFSWLTEVTEHDNASFLGRVDDDFRDFFSWLKNNGFLDKTALFFMSDHGSRMTSISSEINGRIEVRMPLLTMVLPDKFKQKHPQIVENLKNNQKVLTTHFDLHETFRNILDQKFEPVPVKKPLTREISLFQKIPDSRTCADARVSEKFCACHIAYSVSVNATYTQSIAVFIVDRINRKLAPFGKTCYTLRLSHVKEAYSILSGLQGQSDRTGAATSHETYEIESNSRYEVTVVLVPGNSEFKGTVEINKDESFKLLGSIDAIRYQKKKQCLTTEKLLDNFCFC